MLPPSLSSSQHPNKNMSSHSTHLLFLLSPPPSSSSSSSAISSSSQFHACRCFPDKALRLKFRPACRAISKPPTQDFAADVFQNGLPGIKWREIVEDDTEREAPEEFMPDQVKQYVNSIKEMLVSMEDGEISVSAYDTAWVALVEDVNGRGLPQFPSSHQWIANNQNPDGSWGDSQVFFAHDRIINTLACVIALQSWNIHPDKCKKGMAFCKENICKLEGESAEHMPIGFEVAFPSLLYIAQKLNLDLPYDSPILKDIYAKRDMKLSRIPRDIMHEVPTTLLHSLEGMPDLEWGRLLKLQSEDGSFLFSPSSTAFALMQTRNPKCFSYLEKIVRKFKGGVPNVYPVDLFEHIWAVDRLERLGISRYFKPEIKQCINYVYRYWTAKGICWARNSEVHDIDDTAMAFRLLRLNGHTVSADVFRNFEKGGEFVCIAGQSTQAVTGMFNLYRASQILFPGEKILENAKQFSSIFLRAKQASNQLLDKWIITKDIAGEVGYALDVPWYASLPRVETRFYIDQYGGKDDVWIGKTLYRMPYVNNNTYLEFAKLDFNNCQSLHQLEWVELQKWYAECKLREYGLSQKALLFAYFCAAANIYEPERAKERLGWTKTKALVEAIASHFKEESERRAFVHEFRNNIARDSIISGWRLNVKVGGLVGILLRTLMHISLDTLLTRGEDVSHCLHQAWEKWMVEWEKDGDRYKNEAELMVQTIILSAGISLLEDLSSYSQFHKLTSLTNKVCHQLGHCSKHKLQVGLNGGQDKSTKKKISEEIESDMEELVKMVLQKSSSGSDSDINNTFLVVAKSFYYQAYCDQVTINHHIAKVLFEKVH